MNITISDLFEAGVHLGHQKRRWNPKSKAFIYDHRNGISIIDLEKTYKQLEQACAFLQELVSNGQKNLFVATKRQAQEVVLRYSEIFGSTQFLSAIPRFAEIPLPFHSGIVISRLNDSEWG
jgi:ribosomal protein S2